MLINKLKNNTELKTVISMKDMEYNLRVPTTKTQSGEFNHATYYPKTSKKATDKLISELHKHQMKSYHRLNYTALYSPIIKPHADTILYIPSSNTREAMLTRRIIRQTWANRKILSNYNISLTFVLGQRSSPLRSSFTDELTKEILSRNDLLIFNFLESERNFTLKTVSMMKWFAQYTSASFLIKSHSDTLLNLENMHRMIRNTSMTAQTGELIIGHREESQPNRNPSSERFVPIELYSQSNYPAYATGNACVISKQAVNKLLTAVYQTDYLSIDDVYVTGVCRRKSGLNLVHSDKFLIDKSQQLLNVWKNCISVRGYNRSEISYYWKELENL